MSSRGAGPTGHQWNGTPKGPKAPLAIREYWVAQVRMARSVPPVLQEPEVPAAIKDRPAPKDPSARLVPRDPGETPARRALLGLRGPKAKGVLADLQDSLASREQPAIREQPGSKGKSDLKEPPGQSGLWAHQGSQRSK